MQWRMTAAIVALCLGAGSGAHAKLQCLFPAEACGFGNTMPLYDQSHPNFADLEVPCATFSAESHPIYNFPADAGAPWTSAPNPYAHTFLPLGPPAVWAQSGYELTALCGPTSASMLLMAELRNMSPTNAVLPGSWLQHHFQTPDSPSLVRPPQADPGAPSMSTADVQRVANMAAVQGTDPTAGGGGGAFADMADQFVSAAGSHAPAPPTGFLSTVTIDTFASYVAGGHAVVLGLGCYAKTVSAGPTPDTQKIDLSQPCPDSSGHIVALNGYSRFHATPGPGGRARVVPGVWLTIDDPFGALQYVRSYHVVHAGRQPTADLDPAVVGSDDKAPFTIVILPGDRADTTTKGFLYNDGAGDNQFEFIDGYDELLVD
jgi:hypothetical protein